jgi:hypothetical protein
MGHNSRPWTFYAALVAGGVALVWGGLYLLRRAAWMRMRDSHVESAMREDPSPARAREILGVEQLPQGYHASVKPGWLTLTRRDSFRGGEDDTNIVSNTTGFFFLRGPRGPQASRWSESLREQLNHSDTFTAGPLQVKSGERLGSGRFSLGGASVAYVTRRGDLTIDRVTYRGVSALLFFECHGAQGSRVGAWFTPAPRSGQSLTGTAADEQALRAFLLPFRFCQDF